MRFAALPVLFVLACGGDDAGSGDDAAGDGDAGSDAPAIDAPPTGGCGTAGATGVQNGTIDVAGTARTYVLFVPSGYDGSRSFPLVFAWHGRTSNANQARSC